MPIIDDKQINPISKFEKEESLSYLQAVAMGQYSDRRPWTKIGYNGATGVTTEGDVWSGTGTINWPTAATSVEYYSSDNSTDIGTAIKSGTTTAGSTATTLVDSAVDFTAATAVAAGDVVLLDDNSGAWGFVTGVATHTLTLSAGFYMGVTPATGTAYRVVDVSAKANALAVRLDYLTTAFAQKYAFGILNGTTPVAGPTDLYRVNSLRVVAAGSAGKTAGIVDVRLVGGAATVWSRISAGYTRARNIAYTVPASKELYIHEVNCSFGYTIANAIHYARFITRATQFPSGSCLCAPFKTSGIFYPYSEVELTNATALLKLDTPTKIITGVDVKVSCYSSISGVATVALRGVLKDI